MKEHWEKIKLGDVCSKIGSGATPKGGSGVYVEEGTSFIRSQNVYNLHFSYEGLAFINDDAAQKLKGVTVKEYDVLLNITGDSVARTCIVPKNVIPARVNQHVAIIRVFQDRINPFFLNYYLASPFMQSYMLGLAVGKGTSRNAMTKEMIENFTVPCPDLEVQNRIVDVLKEIDLLIENNQKQIKLLEEAAQRLYQEWFVDLRFPGHENVKIVDGVPEGWEKTTLDDVIEFNPSISLSKERIKEFVPMSALSTSAMTLDLNEISSSKTNSGSRFQNDDTIMARITPCLENGKIAFVQELQSEEGSVGSTEYIVMRSKSLCPPMVYLLARTHSFRQYAINSMSGSDGRQRVKVERLREYEYLKPDTTLIEKFSGKVTPFFKRIKDLNKTNIVLQEARDRLLPKLMSGEIEV